MMQKFYVTCHEHLEIHATTHRPVPTYTVVAILIQASKSIKKYLANNQQCQQ